MPHTTREESEESSHLKRAFIPSRTELWALPLISLLVLLGLNTMPAIRSTTGQNYALAVDYIREIVEKLLAPTNNQQGSRVLTIIFWMFIGAVAYIIVWILISLYTNYRRDVLETKNMVLPAGYNKNAAWHETVLRIFVRIISTLIFLYWLYLLFAAILPYASSLFLGGFTSLSWQTLLDMALGTLVLSVSLFVAAIFARCIVLRERVFES